MKHENDSRYRKTLSLMVEVGGGASRSKPRTEPRFAACLTIMSLPEPVVVEAWSGH